MTHAKVTTAIMVALMATPAFAAHVRTTDPGDSAQPVIVKLDKSAAKADAVVVEAPGSEKIMIVETADPADGKQKRIAVRAETRDIEPGGPWLGIQFGPVTRPLATQLNMADTDGQMVLNVAENSPADRAGLLQYDVILNIDGQKITSDLTAFLDIVRGFKPDEAHTFTVVRGGEDLQINIVVGTRPEDWSSTKYKYETDMEAGPFQGRVMRRGGLLQKDDQGNWTFNQLGDDDDMPDVWSLLPDSDHAFTWQAHPGHGNQFQFFNRKGLNVKVERNDDGSYTVTRTEMEDGDEKTTTETFANEAEFKAKYPDGVVEGGPNMLFHMQPFDPNDPKAPRMFQFRIPGPGDNFALDIDLGADVEAMLKEHAKLLEESEALLNGQKMHRLFLRKPGADARAVVIGKAATSFEIQQDGSIRVVTRNAEDELVETFTDGEALRQVRPDLSERYEKLMEIRQDEIDRAKKPAGR